MDLNKRPLFTIHDTKADSWTEPRGAANDEDAKRMFFTLCSQGESVYATNPEDFNLYGCGAFNVAGKSAGMVEGAVPVLVMRGVETVAIGQKPKEIEKNDD